MRKILILIIITALFGCTPPQRIARILKKHPELIKSDTITRIDTITTVAVSRDTVFNYFQKDTVIIREGKLTMKYYYNDHDSTVYLRGSCDPDTIIREIPIQVNSISVNEAKGFLGSIKSFLLNNIFSALLFFLILYVIFRNRH